MNKRRSSLSQVALVTGVAVLSVMLLSGCKSVEESVEGVIGGGAKEAVNSAAQAVALAVEEGKELTMQGDDSEKIVLETSSPVGEFRGMIIDHQVGNIEIAASADDQIRVSARIYNLNNKAVSKNQEKVFEQAAVSIQAEGTQARIRVHAKDDERKDLWDWAKSKYKYNEFGVDYTIELPADISSYKVSNNVGNIELTGLSGVFELKNEVGNVDLVSAGIAGASKISVSTGSVELDVQSLENKGKLAVNVALGDIHAALADTVDSSVDTKVGLGEVSSSLNKSRMGKDGSISLAVDVGNIDVN
ncbi:hypothetical protein [Paenibacillus brevis]|uniref:Adhesin domain-containing protein n=1 Tax=Paenibacillus brevis TaxID=2841508 RepID=A0ABS6FV14_9BACL|nr:hypothetical protein [Paenibacillus brevis]MBU5674050.1 hypothetical protein [Paenibacillus brevis]